MRSSGAARKKTGGSEQELDPFEVAKRKVKGSVPAIVEAMVEKAKQGSCTHAKTLLEMTGAKHMFDGEAEAQDSGEPWAKLVLERLDEADCEAEQARACKRSRRKLRWRSRVEGRAPGSEAGIEDGANAGMDMTWVTDRIAVGGGIWVEERMAEVARAGVTHVIDMQMEFDDTALGERAGVKVLWNPVDDDFEPKPREIFERGVRFAMGALEDPQAKLFVHCAAGVHRAPMMALAVLCATGYSLEQAKRLIQTKRYVVDFAEVYVRSVERFLKGYAESEGRAGNEPKGRRQKSMNTRTKGSSSRLIGRLLIFVWAALLLGAAGAKAAPVKTLVQDTLYRADGSVAQGDITIRWNGFSTSAGEAVAAGQMTVKTDANGGISIPLIPNTGSTPSGSYYRVVIKLDDGTTSEEMWVVPAVATTTVAAIRAKVVPQAVAAQFASRDYVDTELAEVVHLAGTETIQGAKTFVPSPQVPAPTAAGGAANKGYVDQAIAGLATVASTGNYNDLLNKPAGANLASPGAIGAVAPGPVNATVYTVNGAPLASANLSDGALLAKTSTTINGFPISSNVTLSASNLTMGALPNGTTATTQAVNDNSTSWRQRSMWLPHLPRLAR